MSPTQAAAAPMDAMKAGMRAVAISWDQSLNRDAIPMPSTVAFSHPGRFTAGLPAPSSDFGPGPAMPVMNDPHLFQRDQPAAHQVPEFGQERVDLVLGIHDFDDQREVDRESKHL